MLHKIINNALYAGKVAHDYQIQKKGITPGSKVLISDTCIYCEYRFSDDYIPKFAKNTTTHTTTYQWILLTYLLNVDFRGRAFRPVVSRLYFITVTLSSRERVYLRSPSVKENNSYNPNCRDFHTPKTPSLLLFLRPLLSSVCLHSTTRYLIELAARCLFLDLLPPSCRPKTSSEKGTPPLYKMHSRRFSICRGCDGQVSVRL